MGLFSEMIARGKAGLPAIQTIAFSPPHVGGRQTMETQHARVEFQRCIRVTFSTGTTWSNIGIFLFASTFRRALWAWQKGFRMETAPWPPQFLTASAEAWEESSEPIDHGSLPDQEE